MRNQVNELAKEVSITPAVVNTAPAMDTLRGPKYFSSGPFISPVIILHAAFVLMMTEPSVAEKPNALNVSLNTSPKLVMIGTKIS